MRWYHEVFSGTALHEPVTESAEAPLALSPHRNSERGRWRCVRAPLSRWTSSDASILLLKPWDGGVNILSKSRAAGCVALQIWRPKAIPAHADLIQLLAIRSKGLSCGQDGPSGLHPARPATPLRLRASSGIVRQPESILSALQQHCLATCLAAACTGRDGQDGERQHDVALATAWSARPVVSNASRIESAASLATTATTTTPAQPTEQHPWQPAHHWP